jgi:hypothetical protein
MLITKKHLNRRTLLKGAGVTLALPFLDSMVPAQTAISKTAAKSRTRLCLIEMVHGSAGSTVDGSDKHYWAPEKTGTDWEFTQILEPLKDFRDYLTIISDTDLRPAGAFSDAEEGGDHFRSSAVYLSCAHPKLTMGSDILCGATIDQLYAQKFGQDTPLPSMQVCIESLDASGHCDYGYACVYSDTISWASPTQPLPMTIDPRMVFENLFGYGGTAEERAARQQANGSILDRIMNRAKSLSAGLPASDRTRLNEYLEDVREIERRIQKTEEHNRSGVARNLPAAPVGVPDSFEEHIRLMFDLQALAFQTGTTNVSTFKMSRDVCQRVYTESGVKVPFHSCSHHGETPAKIAEFAKLNRYHVSLVPQFLERLKKTPDGDGNLLDHSLIMYGSPLGDSNAHNHKRVPVFLAGKANGKVKGGQHIRCEDSTPMANIHLTLMNKVGMELEKVGDSTGEIAI